MAWRSRWWQRRWANAKSTMKRRPKSVTVLALKRTWLWANRAMIWRTDWASTKSLRPTSTRTS